MRSILRRACPLLLLSLLGILLTATAYAEKPDYALNIYGAKMANNNWQEFFGNTQDLDFINSKLLAFALAKRLGHHKDLLSYEIEGQLVKHFGIQRHWEFNALGTLRWEPFWWDRLVDTSVAFGMGPSFATEKPRAEVLNEGDSQQWMLYWMLEMSLNLPQQPNIALITRLHHRSEGYGLIAEDGGSNALAIGLKYRF